MPAPFRILARNAMCLIALLSFGAGGLLAQDASAGGEGGSMQEGGGANSGQGATGASGESSENSSLQVAPPSVTLPTPALPLPPPLPESTPQPQDEAKPQASPALRPEFNPPTAEQLNLPSAQPAGNPQFAPASVGMPAVTLDDSTPDGSGSSGPGPLGGVFDWAKKLRFQAALRGGYDSNINSSASNAVASTFGNLNGAVNYRFGSPRLLLNADLTGGITQYFNAGNNQSLQGVVGLGLSVEYRFSPRLVLTYNTATSFQQQPNPGLIGTSQNQNGSYIFSANSFSGAYQWSDLFTTVTRLNFTANYYLEQSLNQGQGFNQPGFGQSFRWLVKPTTTAVLDYNTDLYGYAQQGNSSWGQSLSAGFDHIFNPKWFWNFRGGAEFRTYQNANQDGTYIGPYVDSNFSWAFARASSLSWVAHVGTQPAGQQNVSFSPALRTGLNYSQGLTAKLRFNSGVFYLLQYYQDSQNGPNGQLIDYNQSTIQGNIDFSYEINRILQLALGYQYIASMCEKVPSQEYNRGISYLQLKAAF
ncbi:MAG: hypothetical protein WAN16_10285 [Chthoniobacterales bacterium]